jgi:Right handed beta helix region
MFCSKWYLVLSVLVVTVFPGLVQGRTWYVEKDGSGDYTVIQDAINAAAAGDTIRIGPGRFDEYRPYTYPGGIYDVGIYNTLPSLAILGDGELSTTIGVAVDGDGDYSAGLFNDVDMPGVSVSISGLTFEGGFFGALPLDGSIEFSNCTFRGSQNGIWSYASGFVSECRFVDIQNTGIGSFAPGNDLSVRDCEFIGCASFGFYFQSSPDMDVGNCLFENCLVGGFFDISSGSITNCSIDVAPSGTGLGFEGNGRVLISGCTISSAYRNLFIVGASNLTFEGNILEPAEAESIYLATCTPVFHNNHILRGSGDSVLLAGFSSNQEDIYLDMTNNYWGTTEPDSIAAWIHDGNDEYDPIWGIKAFVNFEPFSAVPLDTEKKSIGGFKSMFRDATR